jgi:hypothetical protein
MKLELYIKEGNVIKEEQSKEINRIKELENDMTRMRNDIKMMEV